MVSVGVLVVVLIVMIFAAPGEAYAGSSATISGEAAVAGALSGLGEAGILLGRDASPLTAHEYVARGQLAIYLARALGLDGSAPSAFTDLADSDPCFGAVGALHKAGLVTGTTPTSFSPEESISRQEAVVWIMNALDRRIERQRTVTRIRSALGFKVDGEETPGVEFELPAGDSAARWLGVFRDRELIDPARARTLANAFRLGIIESTSDGSFYPTLPLSWGDMAVLLDRAFVRSLGEKTVYPAVVPADSSLPSLAETSEGPLVWYIENRLTSLKYRPGPVDGVYDEKTRDAVMAFQKVEGLKRDGVAAGEFWQRIFTATTPTPRINDVGTRMEIDLTRQVIFMITDNQVWKIVHCSTGSSGRRTRAGHFQIGDKYKGWVGCVTLSGWMYYPSYVVSKTAIHGYRHVPPYPASHGCIRVPVWMAEEIFYETPTGMTVDIYRSG